MEVRGLPACAPELPAGDAPLEALAERYGVAVEALDGWTIAVNLTRNGCRLADPGLRYYAERLAARAVLQKAARLVGPLQAATQTVREPLTEPWGGELDVEATVDNVIGKAYPERGDWIVQRRDSLQRLSNGLSVLSGMRPPVIRDYVTSMGAWYGYKPWVDWAMLGVSRERVVEALRAENLDVDIPGSPPLHSMALFEPDRFQISGFEKFDNRDRTFPNAESYAAGILSLPTFTGPRDEVGLSSMIEGFHKVWANLDRLRE